MQGPDEGVGTLAMHPSGFMFVLGGRHSMRPPSLGVYAWGQTGKALPLMATALAGGAPRASVAAAIDESGAKLATIATAPDHMLTIWDWQAGEPLLQCKSTGQEVGMVCALQVSMCKLRWWMP